MCEILDGNPSGKRVLVKYNMEINFREIACKVVWAGCDSLSKNCFILFVSSSLTFLFHFIFLPHSKQKFRKMRLSSSHISVCPHVATQNHWTGLVKFGIREVFFKKNVNFG